MSDFGVYHVFNKSIAGYVIFNSFEEYSRMLLTARYYSHDKLPVSLSYLLNKGKEKYLDFLLREEATITVKIIAYCLMPTHFHFILAPVGEKSLAIFMNNLQNSYTRYFNLKHNRRGPLWQGPYGRKLIEDDVSLVTVTKYVHLNPVTAYMVNKPEEWEYSSYGEFVGNVKQNICRLNNLFDMKFNQYRKFVEDNANYQRELSAVNKYIMD